jgi:hypothetical protein
MRIPILAYVRNLYSGEAHRSTSQQRVPNAAHRLWLTRAWRIVAVVSSVLMTSMPLYAADISGESGMIWFKGTIVPGDEARFENLTRDQPVVFVNLDSAGGDVDTALRIGRIMRARGSRAFSDGCYSACVLLYAAGVARVGGIDDLSEVGVHRIYFAGLDPALTQVEVQRLYAAKLLKVREYLAEMNVAPEFLALMQSAPPEKLMLLTAEELERYGLGETDPVYEERNIAKQAWAHGMSSFEYRQQRNKARLACEAESKYQAFRTSRQVCEHAKIWGLSEESYVAKRDHAASQCRGVPSGERLQRCFLRAMRSNAFR